VKVYRIEIKKVEEIFLIKEDYFPAYARLKSYPTSSCMERLVIIIWKVFNEKLD
jgi:hypothetical protein